MGILRLCSGLLRFCEPEICPYVEFPHAFCHNLNTVRFFFTRFIHFCAQTSLPFLKCIYQQSIMYQNHRVLRLKNGFSDKLD